MNTVEKTGKTIEKAVELALKELNADKKNVKIEVLEEGKKGYLGFIGTKEARVRVTLNSQFNRNKEVDQNNIIINQTNNQDDKAEIFLREIFKKMSTNAEITRQESGVEIRYNIKGDDVGIVIGRRGETLDAIQYLTSLVVNKNSTSYKKVIIDIESYRQKREDTLVNLAHKLANRVVKFKKNIILEPMSPYERRIIHATLQDNTYVETCSVGDDPHRKVVIKIKQD